MQQVVRSKTHDYVFSMVSAPRPGGRMDRQPDRQGRQFGTLRQPDRRTYRRRAGRLDILVFRMGARRHAGQPGHGRHRLGRTAVDRGARLAPQDTLTQPVQCKRMVNDHPFALSCRDSNPERQNQNLLCYHYTTAQTFARKRRQRYIKKSQNPIRTSKNAQLDNRNTGQLINFATIVLLMMRTE